MMSIFSLLENGRSITCSLEIFDWSIATKTSVCLRLGIERTEVNLWKNMLLFTMCRMMSHACLAKTLQISVVLKEGEFTRFFAHGGAKIQQNT